MPAINPYRGLVADPEGWEEYLRGQGVTGAEEPVAAPIQPPAPPAPDGGLSALKQVLSSIPWTTDIQREGKTFSETVRVPVEAGQFTEPGPGTRRIAAPEGTAVWTPPDPNAPPSPTAKRMGLYPGAPPGTYNSTTGIFISRADQERQIDTQIAQERVAKEAKERAEAPEREAMGRFMAVTQQLIGSRNPQQQALGFSLRKAALESQGKETIIPEGAMLQRGGQIAAYNPRMPRPDMTPPATAYAPEAVARELYPGTPYNQLDQKQVEAVNRESEKRQVRTGGATTGARVTETIRAQAANAGDIRKIAAARAGGMAEGRIAPDVTMSPQALEAFGLPFGSTWKDAMGMIASNPKARLSVEELKISDNLLNSLGGYADKLITATDAMGAAAQGATLWMGAFTRANTDAAVFADQREALLGIFSRQVGAERGVLTDRDIYRIDKALPNFRDTTQVKDAKIALLRSMIQVNREARAKAISQWFDSDVEVGQVGAVTPPGQPQGGGQGKATKRYNPATGKIEAIR